MERGSEGRLHVIGALRAVERDGEEADDGQGGGPRRPLAVGTPLHRLWVVPWQASGAQEVAQLPFANPKKNLKKIQRKLISQYNFLRS